MIMIVSTVCNPLRLIQARRHCELRYLPGIRKQRWAANPASVAARMATGVTSGFCLAAGGPAGVEAATEFGFYKMKKFFQFSSQVIVAHIVTYIGVGILAYFFLTREFFNSSGIAAQIMRTPDQYDLWRHVTIWMLPFQILRGFLIATVLFPFLPCLHSWPAWKRAATIGGLYIALGQWASTVAGSGTIEGWLILRPEFTTFPVVIKAMVEGFIQGLALSIWISKSINSVKSLSSRTLPKESPDTGHAHR